MIIIGKHAELTPELNEEVCAAFDSKVPIKSFAEVLGEVTEGKDNIVVVGSYGKSTCAALLAWCLEYAGKHPGYVIGAIPTTPATSSAAGQGTLFVIEGDEYPSANWDASSKFLHYHPSQLLITSLAHDHINVFKTVFDYRTPFKKLLSLLPAGGLLVACGDGDGIRTALDELDRPTILYSAEDSNCSWYAKNISYGETTTFDIAYKGTITAHVTTELLGRHNIENIVGAAALLLTGEYITAQELTDAIRKFKAPQRRLNKISDKTRIPMYEGFGSSRDKAVSAISAMRLHYPSRNLIVLFEPHTFSWRTHEALFWYDTVFSGSDRVLIYKPPSHGAQEDQLSLEEIVSRVEKQNISVSGLESPTAGRTLFEEAITENSVVLILSSGGFDGMIEDVKKFIEQTYPKE